MTDDDMITEADILRERLRLMIERAEDAEAKLAKAVGGLQNIAGKVPYADDPWDIACAALKELEDKTDE